MPDNEFSRANDGDNEPYFEEPPDDGERIERLKEVIFDDEAMICKIRMHPNDIGPDRTQYKPYSPTYNFPFTTLVEVTVPYNMIADRSPNWVVLTPEGIAHIADQLATALDIMHDEFRSRPRRL